MNVRKLTGKSLEFYGSAHWRITTSDLGWSIEQEIKNRVLRQLNGTWFWWRAGLNPTLRREVGNNYRPRSEEA